MWLTPDRWLDDWRTISDWVEHLLNSAVHKLRSVFDWQVEADIPAAAMAGDGCEPDGKPPPP